MFWSLDSDKIGADSLVGTSVGILGGLDQTQVCPLNYEIRSYSKARGLESPQVTDFIPIGITILNQTI